MDNQAIAQQLLDAAHSLEKTHANFYRVRAYRRAAQVIRGLDTGFLVAAEVVEHPEHMAARDKLAQMVNAGDLIATT